MSTDSHSAMAAEISRLRAALREIRDDATKVPAGAGWQAHALAKIRDACTAALAGGDGAGESAGRAWTFALEERPEWHSIPVGVIRAADEDVLFVQFYPEWTDHREAVALVLAAANGGRADA